MSRSRGQVLVLFVLALPVLLGLLGLALDGGYYFAGERGVQVAATTGARAAAVDLQAARYTVATANGQTIGQRNLSRLNLAGSSVSIAYNNTANASPTGAGWYTTTPSASTRSVRATATGTYGTLFMRMVGFPSVTLQRHAVVTYSGGAPPPAVVPVAVCQATMAAMDANPTVPQIIWQFQGSLCGVPSWSGLIDLTGSAQGCSTYKNWVGPPASGPTPAVGTTVTLSSQNCNPANVGLDAYHNQVVWALVVDVQPGSSAGTINCYRQLRIMADFTSTIVRALPASAACSWAES